MARQWLKAFSLLEVETRDGARRSFVLELARGLPMQLWSAALNGRKRESGPEILAVESLGTGGSNSKSTAQVKPCASLHLALLTLPISCSSIVYSTDIRARAYSIWGSGSGVGATDARSRDRKMDAYIAERKGTPAFADSFIPEASTTRIPMSNQDAILRTDIRKILSAEVQVYDDRESPPR